MRLLLLHISPLVISQVAAEIEHAYGAFLAHGTADDAVFDLDHEYHLIGSAETSLQSLEKLVGVIGEFELKLQPQDENVGKISVKVLLFPIEYRPNLDDTLSDYRCPCAYVCMCVCVVMRAFVVLTFTNPHHPAPVLSKCLVNIFKCV